MRIIPDFAFENTPEGLANEISRLFATPSFKCFIELGKRFSYVCGALRRNPIFCLHFGLFAAL